MKKAARNLAAVGCALALTAGSAAVSSAVTRRNLDARPMDVKLVVAGREFTSKAAKPFSIGGAVYLPLQTVGEALGKSVDWDSETNTVLIGKPPLEEDALQLIETLEQTHPAFALDAVPEGYAAAKTALLELAADPDGDLADFTWAAMACMVSLKDEHTRLDPFGGTPQDALDIGWVADGERLYLTDADGAVTAAEVTAVGGVPTAELFAVIDRYVASENQSGRDLNHAQWAASPAMADKAGAAFSDGNTLELTLREGGAVSARTIGLVMQESAGEEHVISTRRIGDVFYVDFNQCVDGGELQLAVSQLREAVQGGTKKVIVDVRGNGGGNSETCEQLLDAMGMAVPGYGMYVRYSPLAHGTYPDLYEAETGGDRYDPDPGSAKANPDVKLAVLTDEGTFSSATMMGVFVRDGKLGALVGRPSSNAPNSYGDILQFQLYNTRIYCTVSHKQWLRPDQGASGEELIPDIVTAVGEDALPAALAFLAE